MARLIIVDFVNFAQSQVGIGSINFTHFYDRIWRPSPSKHNLCILPEGAISLGLTKFYTVNDLMKVQLASRKALDAMHDSHLDAGKRA